MKKLDLNLPLKVSLMISDEDYWKRRVEKTWPVVNISEYGSYKKLFFEKYLEEKIEAFVPKQSDEDELDDLVDLIKHEITNLRLTQLLPPIPQVEDIKDGEDFNA